MKRTSKHRKQWRIALFVGIPLLVLVVAALALVLISSRAAPDEEIPVEPKAIPSDWLTPSISIQSESITQPQAAKVVPSSGERPLLTDRIMSGALAIIANGKQFGEESYELQISSGDGVHMISNGTFSFKVLFATIKAVFSQSLSLDRDLRPDHYTLEMNGPLGIGSRRIEGAVVGNVAHVISGDVEKEIQLGIDIPLVLGTFSTYALIPLLTSSLGDGEMAEFQVIPLFGGSTKDDAISSDADVLLRVERAGHVLIKTGSREVLVDKYIVISSIGNSTLLAKDDEFLAFVASSSDGSLIAYRSDYFPDGIELP